MILNQKTAFSVLKILSIAFVLLTKDKTIIQSCSLPPMLKLNKIHQLKASFHSHFFSETDKYGLQLDVPSNRHFKFDLNSWLATNQLNSCNQTRSFENFMHVRFPKNYILQREFNFQGLIEFLLLFENFFRIYVANLHAIELDLGITQILYEKYSRTADNYEINFYNTRFDFRLGGQPVKSCQQFTNRTQVKSIFQIFPRSDFPHMIWLNPKFVRPLCPLVFKNAGFKYLATTGVVNSFYKHNSLSFTNDTFGDLDSWIYSLQFYNSENIELDTKLLNPSVFAKLEGNKTIFIITMSIF